MATTRRSPVALTCVLLAVGTGCATADIRPRDADVATDRVEVVTAPDTVSVDPNCWLPDDTVEVTGKVLRKTFLGSPGYGETPEIDRIETSYFLELEEPICTAADIMGTPESDVRLMQIVQIVQIDYHLSKRWLGKTIRLRGEWYHAQNGHHRTNILLIPYSRVN